MDCSRLDEAGLNPTCCDSCHEDWEMGYEACEIEDGNGGWLVVCCALSEDMESALRTLVNTEKALNG